MDFPTWRNTCGLSVADIARQTHLPVAVIEQMEKEGQCADLAVARRLRMKLYQEYHDPVILAWTFREDDEGGLPASWWWRCTWEEPHHVRVCLLLPGPDIDDARDQYWQWINRCRMTIVAYAPNGTRFDSRNIPAA